MASRAVSAFWPEAAAAFEKVVAIEPEFARAHLHLGIVYAIVGRLPEAQRQYEILSRLDRMLAAKLKDSLTG